MARYKIFIRPDDVVATLAKDKEAEQEYLQKGYSLIGIAKVDDKFDVMGVRIVKGRNHT